MRSADEGVRLAAACDDGVTRFFTVDEGVPGLTYQRSLGRVEGRALSLAWHPAGATLFSGHSDAIIRAWSASNGREIYRIDAGAQSTSHPAGASDADSDAAHGAESFGSAYHD